MNSTTARGVLCAAIMGALMITTMPRATNAQATAVTIGAGLAQSSGAIDDIAAKAGNEANYVVFSAAAELRVLIENLRLSARDVLGEGFSELNNTQQQAFDNIQKSIASLRKALDEPIEQGRQTVEEVHQIVNDTPLVGAKQVTIIRSRPSVIAPSPRDEIPFVVRGLSLDKGKPRLFFGNVEAKRIELVQQQAVFAVPSRVFTHAPASATSHSGRLVVTAEECSWLVFCKDVEREYRIAVMALPAQVAKVFVTYSRKSEQRVYREPPFARNFGHSTGDLTHEKCTTENQGPHAPGYFIDTESVAPHRTHGRARNSWEVLNKTPGGFSVRMCVQAQMHTPFKKRSGEITVNVKWREYKLEDVVTPFEALDRTELSWGTNLAQNLPADVNAISVRLEYFDKSIATYVGNGADKYMSVTWNAGTRQLVLTPKAPGSIVELG